MTAACLANEADRLVRRKRIQPQQHRVARGRTPVRSLLEELVPRECQNQRAPRSARPTGRQSFDEVEHRRLEEMRVIEHDHHRVITGQAVDHRDHSGLHVVYECRLLRALGKTEQRREPLDGAGGFGGIAAAIHELAQLKPNLLGRIPRIDSRQVSDDGCRRRERCSVGRRAALATEDHDRGADASGELVGQSRFTDAGLAHHGDQHRPARGAREPEALVEDGLLARAPDERNRAPRGPGRESFDGEGIECRIEALGLHVTAASERDLGGREGVRRQASEELPRLCR